MLRHDDRKSPARVHAGRDDTCPGRPKVGPGAPADEALRSALEGGLHGLLTNEQAAREGDERGVHQLRTTTRRLRTALGLFGALIEPAWAEAVGADLKWLAGLTGAARDLDVLTRRFQTAADAEGWVVPLGPLFAAFRVRHDAAAEALKDALSGDRYAGLVDRLTGSHGDPTRVESAAEPCRTALPALVGKVWKRLKRAGRALGPDDPDGDFHEVRKWAKRARYSAEAVADALDPGPAADAIRFAHRARDVQDVLGAHQDSVIAASEVRDLAAAHPALGPFNFAAGQLLERERRAAADTRAAAFEVWDGLDRKKVVRWLKS